MEEPGHEPSPIWDAGMVGGSLSHHTTVPVLLVKFLIRHSIFLLEQIILENIILSRINEYHSHVVIIKLNSLDILERVDVICGMSWMLMLSEIKPWSEKTNQH